MACILGVFVLNAWLIGISLAHPRLDARPIFRVSQVIAGFPQQQDSFFPPAVQGMHLFSDGPGVSFQPANRAESNSRLLPIFRGPVRYEMLNRDRIRIDGFHSIERRAARNAVEVTEEAVTEAETEFHAENREHEMMSTVETNSHVPDAESETPIQFESVNPTLSAVDIVDLVHQEPSDSVTPSSSETKSTEAAMPEEKYQVAEPSKVDDAVELVPVPEEKTEVEVTLLHPEISQESETRVVRNKTGKNVSRLAFNHINKNIESETRKTPKFNAPADPLPYVFQGKIARELQENAGLVVGAILGLPMTAIICYFMYLRLRRHRTGSLDFSNNVDHHKLPNPQPTCAINVCCEENEMADSPTAGPTSSSSGVQIVCE